MNKAALKKAMHVAKTLKRSVTPQRVQAWAAHMRAAIRG